MIYFIKGNKAIQLYMALCEKGNPSIFLNAYAFQDHGWAGA